MKLLSKSEIASKQSEAKRIAIDEGRKLAKTVDDLRELQAQETINLEKFRADTVGRIYKEIEQAEESKKSLLADIRNREKELRDLRKPLDEEWNALNEEKCAFSKMKSELDQNILDMTEREKILKRSEKEVSTALVRISYKEETTNKLLLEADSKQKEAHESIKRAQEIEAHAISFANSKGKELETREIQLSSDEKRIIERDKQQDERERELNNKERLINDRYQTLMRSEKRLKEL